VRLLDIQSSPRGESFNSIAHSIVAKQMETRHRGRASVKPSAGECEMAAREKIFVRYSDSVETLQTGEAEDNGMMAKILFQ
jgi:hypothetical protein